MSGGAKLKIRTLLHRAILNQKTKGNQTGDQRLDARRQALPPRPRRAKSAGLVSTVDPTKDIRSGFHPLLFRLALRELLQVAVAVRFSFSADGRWYVCSSRGGKENDITYLAIPICPKQRHLRSFHTTSTCLDTSRTKKDIKTVKENQTRAVHATLRNHRQRAPLSHINTLQAFFTKRPH